MNILAIDSSSKAASCAYMSDGKLIGEFFTNAGLTHSQTIMPMISQLLNACRVSINSVDVYGISVGPGSFTGLRIGIATVKGLAFDKNKLCAPVSTLKALAYNLPYYSGYVIPCMDARRNQVYTGVFQYNDSDLIQTVEDTVIQIAQLSNIIADINSTDITLIGDGAHLVHSQLADTYPYLRVAPESLLHQRASSICLATQEIIAKDMLIPAENIQPVYLRLSQAERELKDKQ